jgi:hypothetical protein
MTLYEQEDNESTIKMVNASRSTTQSPLFDICQPFAIQDWKKKPGYSPGSSVPPTVLPNPLHDGSFFTLITLSTIMLASL